MNSETYKYTSCKSVAENLPSRRKNLCIQSWYKGKETTTPLKTTTTPSFTPTFDENDDMTAVYQEAVPTAELTVKGSADIVENGATMDHWEVLLKKYGRSPVDDHLKSNQRRHGPLASARPILIFCVRYRAEC